MKRWGVDEAERYTEAAPDGRNNSKGSWASARCVQRSMAWLQSLQKNKQRLHALLRSITAFGIRRDPKNPAAFVLSMGSLLKGSWYYGCERLLELWGLRSLHFPVQGRELVITQSANHWLTTGTHRDLHEPHKGYTCTQGILIHHTNATNIKSLPKFRADLTSQQYTLHMYVRFAL